MDVHYQKPIEGLRGLAILLVILFHTHIVQFGWSGVILFFVLSGYLITNVLWAEKEKSIPLKLKFRNFWARRILRIFPLYYLYLFILIIGLAAKLISIQVANEMPWLFTYTYNFYLINVYETIRPSFLAGHLWTLAIEEQFYLFYPALLFLLNRQQMKFAVIGLILGSIFFRILYNGNESYLGFHTFSYLDSFLFGAGIFIFQLDKLRRSIVHFIFIFATISILVGGFIVYMDMIGGRPFHLFGFLSSLGIEPYYSKNYYRTWGLINLNFFYSSILLILLYKGKSQVSSWLKWVFGTKFFVAVGKVSYGMYVFHAIIIWILMGLFENSGNHINKYFFSLMSIICIWAVSFAIYHLYEKRFLKLKDRFR